MDEENETGEGQRRSCTLCSIPCLNLFQIENSKLKGCYTSYAGIDLDVSMSRMRVFKRRTSRNIVSRCTMIDAQDEGVHGKVG